MIGMSILVEEEVVDRLSGLELVLCRCRLSGVCRVAGVGMVWVFWLRMA